MAGPAAGVRALSSAATASAMDLHLPAPHARHSACGTCLIEALVRYAQEELQELMTTEHLRAFLPQASATHSKLQISSKTLKNAGKALGPLPFHCPSSSSTCAGPLEAPGGMRIATLQVPSADLRCNEAAINVRDPDSPLDTSEIEELWAQKTCSRDPVPRRLIYQTSLHEHGRGLERQYRTTARY